MQERQRVVEADWLELLDTAEQLLHDNEGVPLAPQTLFPAMDAEGVMTVTTEASDVDGIGGYAFTRDERGETT
eukprot:5784746-Pleurochrysis_carterae.AAC.1